MKPLLLFVVTSDPRTSGRPAEAIRVAAGVGAWRKAEVALYLRGPAVLALGEFADELVDEENYVRYLPLAREWERPVYVARGEPLLAELGEPAVPFEAIDDSQLAELAARSAHLLHF